MRDNQPISRVYLLPNLMTAGNLFCGFMAVLQIMEGTILRRADADGWLIHYQYSLYFILGAFIFDILDGRVARLGGQESPFGREFDSLADLVSFGIAPALLVFKIVLYEMPNRIGWAIAFIYLAAGALRLARFNVIASNPTDTKAPADFKGIPIPAAAGMIASIALLLLHLYEGERIIGHWKYLLAALMLLLSFLMFSGLRYPSFKTIDWKTRHTVPQLFLTVLILSLILLHYRYALAAVFTAYMLSGIVRPFWPQFIGLIPSKWKNKSLNTSTKHTDSGSP